MISMQASVVLPISAIKPRYTREDNPNKITDEDFAALVALVQAHGFLQPVLVRKPIKRMHPLIDGHHRYWACIEAGATEISAVVHQGRLTDKDADLLGLGLNRLRGEPDVRLVGLTLDAALKGGELSLGDAQLLTGMSAAEINDALELLSDAGEPELLTESDGADAVTPPKPFVLEVTFDDRATYQRCRRLLRRAAGKGGDLAQGLLAVLGET